MKMVYSWATAGQLECIKMFCDLVGGHHNIDGNFLDLPPNGIAINQRRSMASFDNDWLSRLVFMAHDRCIRVELQAIGIGKLRVIMQKRAGRDGSTLERHPALDSAIYDYYRGSTLNIIQN